MESLTSHTDGVDQFQTRIGASPVSTRVMVASMRREHTGDYAFLGAATLSSADAGETWTGATIVGAGLVWTGDVLYQEANNRWLIGLDEGSRLGPARRPGRQPRGLEHAAGLLRRPLFLRCARAGSRPQP